MVNFDLGSTGVCIFILRGTPVHRGEGKGSYLIFLVNFA